MDSTDVAAIEHHRRRSYGRSPIDATGSTPDLSALLRDAGDS
jgi:hypothetical protein